MQTQKVKENLTEDTRLALLEQSINHINETLKRMEKRFDLMDQKFESLNNKLWSMQLWIIGGFASILLIIAHSLHWF
jgi:uncharacterized coiled-coil protein SlyX